MDEFLNVACPTCGTPHLTKIKVIRLNVSDANALKAAHQTRNETRLKLSRSEFANFALAVGIVILLLIGMAVGVFSAVYLALHWGILTAPLGDSPFWLVVTCGGGAGAAPGCGLIWYLDRPLNLQNQAYTKLLNSLTARYLPGVDRKRVSVSLSTDNAVGWWGVGCYDYVLVPPPEEEKEDA